MHNGVYTSLDQVLHFYNKGGGQGFGQDLPNQTLPSDQFNLKQNELDAIKYFMLALTDTTGMTQVPNALPQVPGMGRRVVGGLY
jgi:cytochrome c peroxidase